jgi:hypothetical protein
MAAPIVMSSEELFQLTGSWEAAAALRDEQYRALNAYNWSQAAPAPVVAPAPAPAPAPVTSAQIVDFLLANPGMSDAQIVGAMEQYKVSPAQMAQAVGLDEGAVAARVAATVPQGQTVTLGDTIVQPVYQVTGSGQDQQIGGLENVLTYRVGENQAGGAYNQYTPTGELERTGTQQKVESGFGEFLAGAGLLFGGAALAGLGGGAGAAATVGSTGLTMAELAQLDLALGGAGGTAGATQLATALTTGALTPTLTNLTGGSGTGTIGSTGLTLSELSQLDLSLGGTGGTTGALTLGEQLSGLAAGTLTGATASTGLLGGASTVAGMGTGTGITTAGATGLGGATTVAGLGTGVGTGLTTAGAGLGAAGTGAGITAGTGLTATGVLAGSGLGTTLLGTTAGALTGTGVLAGSGLGTTLLGTGAGTGVTNALTTGVGTRTLGTGALTTLPTTIPTSGLTASQIAALLSGGLNTSAGLLQQQTSREAAQRAQAMIDRETTLAKQAAQFRPVGMTTRFGSSQFQVDPVTGQLISAGYTLDPQAKNAQDRFIALAEQGLQQAESAQEQFKPALRGAESLATLGQGYLDAQTDPRLAQIASQYLAQSPESKMLTSLGSQYIAQSPQEVAQNYLNQQMALLQPGRELELANLQNRLQQQGRGGLSVAQGGTLGATTPELQALYNARATQEAQLAANAQQAGQQQVQFGAGLVGTGQQLGMQGQQFGMDTLARQQALEQQRIGFGSGLFNQAAGLMGQYYSGQQAAYAPYNTAMGQVQNLEALAQQPLTMGAALGQQAATAGANVGRLGLSGAEFSTRLATGNAATTNPYSTLLSGLGASPAFGQAIGGLFS